VFGGTPPPLIGVLSTRPYRRRQLNRHDGSAQHRAVDVPPPVCVRSRPQSAETASGVLYGQSRFPTPRLRPRAEGYPRLSTPLRWPRVRLGSGPASDSCQRAARHL